MTTKSRIFFLHKIFLPRYDVVYIGRSVSTF